jgi:WD40 repeat protein
MRDGKSIYSGWHDGKIRTFLPQSGRLLYAINDCHANGVTSICATSDGRKIVSGGMNGEIRVWKIVNQSQTMETSLKEHRGRVFSIVVNSQNDRAVSASADGSCIIWDIINYVRTACLFERTLFKQIVYHPEESQILTTGTNKKITYWDVTDYTEIRSVDATLEGSVNSLSMFNSGEFFVSAGDDREVKIWEYDTAIPRFKGLGHSNPINKVIVAPNQEIICSVSEDGSIFIFATPKETRVAKRDLRKPQ